MYFVKSKKKKTLNIFNVYDTLGPCLTSTFQSFLNRSTFYSLINSVNMTDFGFYNLYRLHNSATIIIIIIII